MKYYYETLTATYLVAKNREQAEKHVVHEMGAETALITAVDRRVCPKDATWIWCGDVEA